MKIHRHYALKKLHTFGVDVYCKRLVQLQHPEEIALLRQEGVFKEPFYILGGGSNTLFTQDFDGTILQLQNRGIEIVKEDQKTVIVKAAAGEKWASMVDFCLKNNFYGIENLIDIPGWTGSVPVQNIGAYGTEAKDVVYQVDAISIPEGIAMRFDNADCQFGYRDSIFKHKYRNQLLICAVSFLLHKEPQFNLEYESLKNYWANDSAEITLARVAQAVKTIRASKLPDVNIWGNAGSFFKNPVIKRAEFTSIISHFPNLIYYSSDNDLVKLSAGSLIEQCGLKGYCKGNVAIYNKQALIIVNCGDATGKEIEVFYKEIQNRVFEKFGIHITPEVNIL